MSDTDTSTTTERMEVQRTIRADPSAIFAVLSDPDGHVSIDASGMLMSATGDAASKVGDTFEIHMDREALNDFPLGEYDVTVKFVTFEQDREIAWTIEGLIKPPIGHVYGYRLEPVGPAETDVTSYCDWSGAQPNWKARAPWPIVPLASLERSLANLERIVVASR